MHIIHSLILNGRMTAKASNTQIMKVSDEIKRKEATPNARPILKIVPLAFGLLYIPNKPANTYNRIVLQSKGAEK